VKEQTFQDLDILLIDDNSSESYAGVLDQFQCLHPKYLRNPKNLGAIPNMLFALNGACDSKYKMVFHEDDLMHPQMLELEVRAMEQEPDVVFAGSSMQIFEGTPTPATRAKPFNGRYERYDQVSDLVRNFMRGAPFAFGSVLYRSSAVEKVAADMTRFSAVADRPLLCELAKKGSSLFLPDPLLFYRSHGPSDSRGSQLTEKHLIELCRYYRSCLPERWDPADEALFYSFATNNLLDSYPRLNAGTRPNFLDYVTACRKAGVFRARSLDFRGAKAAIKCLWSRVHPR